MPRIGRLRNLAKDFAFWRETLAHDRVKFWRDVHFWLTNGGSFRAIRRKRLQQQWIQDGQEPRSERFLGWLGIFSAHTRE